MLRTRFFFTWFSMLFIVVMIIFPVYWGIRTSLVDGYNLALLPTKLTLDNYRFLFKSGHFINNVKNSLIVSVGALSFTLPVAVLAGYSLARFNFPGKRYSTVLLVIPLLPAIAVLVPLILYMRGLGIYNTLYSVILATTVFILPYTTWMIRGFMLSIPLEIEEAAQLDGCGPLPRALPHCFAAGCAWLDCQWHLYPDLGLEQLSVFLCLHHQSRSPGGSGGSARLYQRLGHQLWRYECGCDHCHVAAADFLPSLSEVVCAGYVGWCNKVSLKHITVMGVPRKSHSFRLGI